VPIAQHTEALCDKSGRGDVELPAKPDARPHVLARLNHFQG
jgi:hypothetical protein